jgi:tetratricopeptide (TPR) repeat protein
MKVLFACAAISLVIVASRASAEEQLAPEAAFQRGADLMEKRRFKEALPYLKKAEKAYPTSPGVLWNLGIANSEVGNASEALSNWQKCRKAKPDDWKATAKVIQAYQALGDARARDREIQGLYALRAKGQDVDLRKAARFCREQFVVAGHRLFAFEYFEPQGERRLYYRFSVVDEESGRERSYISLGSYDLTTNVLRELGEIPPTARAYHVDRYQGDAHWTYAHFNEKQPYDVVRKMVVDILQGKAKPVSGSSQGTAQHGVDTRRPRE